MVILGACYFGGNGSSGENMKGARVEEQLGFLFPTVMTPLGDGSFKLSPGKPVSEMRVVKAAEYLAVSESSVYRLIDCGLLRARRAMPHRLMVSVESIEQYKNGTMDPEFWAGRKVVA